MLAEVASDHPGQKTRRCKLHSERDKYTLDRSKSKKIQYRVHSNPEWTKTRNSRISAADDGRTARRGWHERSGPQRAPTETGSIR